jgi:hypothetical protein
MMCDLGAHDDDFPFLSFFSLKSEGLPQNLQMEEILGERGQIPSRPWLNLDRNSWIKNAQHDNKRHHKHLCSCFPSVPLKLIDRREGEHVICLFLSEPICLLLCLSNLATSLIQRLSQAFAQIVLKLSGHFCENV